MKIGVMVVWAVSFLAIAGCERLERVVGLGHLAQEETKRAADRQTQVDVRQTSLQAERDSLEALICGKLAVLSNRVGEAEAAIRTLQADRAALSRELAVALGGKQATDGVGLERALASPVVNGLAMKYLHMDFSVARGEYAEAIVKARKGEADFKATVRKLDQTFEGSVDRDSQVAPAARRARTIAGLEREYDQLARKQNRLARVTIPTGEVYRNRQREHDREVREVETRMREIKRMIDRIKMGDERERKDSDRRAEFTRGRALAERNLAVEKLTREQKDKMSVLQTVQAYSERTLRRLEQKLVDEAGVLDEKLRKSREGLLTLQGIRTSVPRLSAEGIKKLQGQILAL